MERENINLWMRFKERQYGHCRKRKGCEISVTNQNRKRCKLRGTREYNT